MFKRLFLVIGMCALGAAPVAGEELIQEFRGTEGKLTDEFEVDGPWIIDWLVGSDYPNVVGFELSLVDANSRLMKGRIIKIKSTGYGTKLFAEPGRYRFRISSSFANWRIKVTELTEEEANAMVPIEKDPVSDMIRQR